MKIILALATLLMISGCGIMSLIFGMPERHITRDVKTDEMVGVWKITPKSKDTLNAFVKKYPDWRIAAPMKTITIHNDHTCKAKVEEKWQHELMGSKAAMCSWKLSTSNGFNSKEVPVIDIYFGTPDDYSTAYFLFIAEGEGKLVLWNVIGDPDDFITEDFVKTKQ